MEVEERVEEQVEEEVEVSIGMADSAPVHVRYLGQISAGDPSESIEIAGMVEVPENFLGENSFALQVQDDTMMEDGIRKDDILIINRRSSINNGQTVVALVGEETLVRKFIAKGDEIELSPAHDEMKSLCVPKEEVKLVGVVVGLMRNYQPRPVKKRN